MWLDVFIILCVASISATILWLHIDFWDNIDCTLLMFLTLPFCIVIAFIDLILIIKDNIKYKG
jgi:hypothetical protein